MQKNIIIYNRKDKLNFIEDLSYYKTFLYHFTTFTSSSLDPEIQEIINALNIKSRKKRISYVYDSALKRAERYFKKIDISSKKIKRNRTKKIPISCNNCPNKKTNKCPINNVSCKLYYSSLVLKKDEVLSYDDLNVLKVLSKSQQKRITKEYNLEKEQVIKDLYYGPIVGNLLIMRRLRKIQKQIK